MLPSFARKVVSSTLLSPPFTGESVASHHLNVAARHWALIAADSFSQAEWAGIQLMKLKDVLTHAAENVPYWKRTLAERSFNPAHLTRLGDIQTLPTIKRSDLKRLPNDFIALTVPLSRRREAYTSGSTGEPLCFYKDSRESVGRELNILQEFRYGGYNLTPPVLILGLRSHPQLNAFGRRFGSPDLEDDHMRKGELYNFLKVAKTKFAIGAPSLLERLMVFMRCDEFSYPFRAIQFRGEPLAEHRRRELSAFFQCPLLEDYGTRECSTIGMQCKQSRLHLAPWTNYVEIVDEAGRQLPTGTEGDIVVTYFENWVMPFIRYRIGDRGRIRPDPCPCGRATATIECTGREAGLIEFSDGSAIPVLRVITNLTKKFHQDIVRFQLELRDGNELIFRFIPTPACTPDREARLQRFLDDLFGEKVGCLLEKVSQIPPNASDKTPLFVHRSQGDSYRSGLNTERRGT